MSTRVAVVPRPAATVVVARPTDEPFEILLLRRPVEARFAPGAYAFPGGVIDEDDASPAWADRIPSVAEPTACVAALRELFEETGFLPGNRHAAGFEELARARGELLSQRARFSEVAADLAIDFSGVRVVYFARWITPASAALRFDTRFFLLAADEPLGSVSLTVEHDAALWATPAAALRRYADGRLPMLFPTVRTLECLAGFASISSGLEALRDLSVEPALVKLREGRGEARPLAPGDPGYDGIP